MDTPLVAGWTLTFKRTGRSLTVALFKFGAMILIPEEAPSRRRRSESAIDRLPQIKCKGPSQRQIDVQCQSRSVVDTSGIAAAEVSVPASFFSIPRLSTPSQCFLLSGPETIQRLNDRLPGKRWSYSSIIKV